MTRRRPTSVRKKYRVFISHHGDDTWVARCIAEKIEALGADTFLDAKVISIGDNFAERIVRAMKECRELVVLLTPWSRSRDWVLYEVGLAKQNGLRLIPVLYHLTQSDIEQSIELEPLRGLKMVDINRFDDYLQELKKRLRAS